MKHARLLAGLAGLLAVCCGGSISVDELYGGLPAAFGGLRVCAFGLAPEYKTLYDSGLAPALAEAKRAIASGRVKYDGGKAKSCLDQLTFNTSTCWGPGARPATALLQIRPADCLLVFSGTLADGAACYSDPDCLSYSCSHSNAACPGKCDPTRQLGADCSTGSCVPGLVCLQAASGPPKCGPPGGAGAACTYDEECQSGLPCALGKCGGGAAQNATCSHHQDCGAGLWCSSGTCQAQVDAGAPCTATGRYLNSFSSPQCKGNQECVGPSVDANGNVVSGKCATPQDVGGPCVRPASGNADPTIDGCMALLVCDPSSSKCVMAPKAGSACLEGQCDPASAYCTGGSCAAQVDDGQPCTSSSQCHASSRCDFNLRTCRPRSSGGGNVCHEP
jgi:hypothetical protein